jgi:hypothetical protein
VFPSRRRTEAYWKSPDLEEQLDRLRELAFSDLQQSALASVHKGERVSDNLEKQGRPAEEAPTW